MILFIKNKYCRKRTFNKMKMSNNQMIKKKNQFKIIHYLYFQKKTVLGL
jgi:hypothetical protein